MPIVFDRRTGQGIEVDGPATIIVRKIRGRRVDLQIVAERSTNVDRIEVAERKRRDAERAA